MPKEKENRKDNLIWIDPFSTLNTAYAVLAREPIRIRCLFECTYVCLSVCFCLFGFFSNRPACRIKTVFVRDFSTLEEQVLT